MNKRELFSKTKYPVLLLLIMITMQTCSTVAFTGRRQLNLVSGEQVLALSLQQYQEYIKSAPVERGTANAEMVNRVGTRIAAAVETFYRSNGYESELKDYQWEFNLVKENSVNAFAMPGGKIVVLEGLLAVTQTEEALAVVLGHEVAHVIAQHSAERISQQMAVQYGGAIAGGLMGSSAAAQLGQQVFGIGAQLGVMLPYARKQELEADEIGLIIMALAGYNPEVAIPFWQRMAQSSGGSTSELLSTHPSDQKRIEKIQAALPNAMQYYKGAGVQNKTVSNIKTSTSIPTANQAKTSEEWSF